MTTIKYFRNPFFALDVMRTLVERPRAMNSLLT